MSNCFFLTVHVISQPLPAHHRSSHPLAPIRSLLGSWRNKFNTFYFIFFTIFDQNIMDLKTTVFILFFFLTKITWNWKQPVFLLQLQYCCSHNPGFNLLFFLSIHLYYFFFCLKLWYISVPLKFYSTPQWDLHASLQRIIGI